MKITIQTSTIVPPISETPKEVIWNSNVDLVVPRIHVASLYFYKPKSVPNFFSGDVIREAIGKTLVPFYPMAGRLMRDEAGRIAINCAGQGVLFVEAEAEARVADFGNFAPQPALQELVPKVPSSTVGDISPDPLLLLQVTRFKCGGVSFGVGMQHHIADGMSGIHFINTIAAFARGDPVNVNPFMDRTILRARDPPTPKFPHVEYLPPPPLLPSASSCPEQKILPQKKILAAAANGQGAAPAVGQNCGVHEFGQADDGIDHTHANGHAHAHAHSQRNGNYKVVPNEYRHGNGVHTNGSTEKISVSSETSDVSADLATNKKHTEVSRAGEEVKGINGVPELECIPMAVAVFVLKKEQLAALKKKAVHKDNPVGYSTYEMLSGHIWKCMCLARGLDEQQSTKLYIATDGRSRLVPRLPKDYFGNAIFTSTPMSTAGEIIETPLYYTAGVIRDAVARMDNEYLRSALDFLELQPDLTKLVRGAHTFRSPNLGITSWARMPLYDCDFGWGRPIFMGPACIAYDGLVYVLPSPVDDGSFTLSLGLRADYMEKFKNLILNVDDAE